MSVYLCILSAAMILLGCWLLYQHDCIAYRSKLTNQEIMMVMSFLIYAEEYLNLAKLNEPMFHHLDSLFYKEYETRLFLDKRLSEIGDDELKFLLKLVKDSESILGELFVYKELLTRLQLENYMRTKPWWS